MGQGSNTGGDNRWTRAFNNAKERAHNAPKNAADSVKKGVSDKIDLEKQKFMHSKPVEGFKNAKAFGQEFKNAKGFKGKAGLIANKASQKFKSYEFYKKMKEMFLKIQKVASWVAAHAYPIAIVTAVVLVLYNGTLFAISIIESVSPTPHYYCDTEASASLKKTAVYQQYCGDRGFDLENLNGHYIIQDGSGPCTDCATANMFMRYYTSQGLNFFDYLWDETGQYQMCGETLDSSLVSTPVTIRKAINGGTSAVTDTTCGSPANGAAAFASKNGVGGWTMANWGYLRDESLDLSAWDATSDYYLSNADSDKWVFDLSIPNNGAGSSWAVYWSQVLGVDSILCIENTSPGGTAITGDTIKDLLCDPNVCGDAGILLYFDYDGDGEGNHAILITKYEESTGLWYGIDSARGLAGGYEGPMDGSGNFVWKDIQVRALLNSGSNRNGNYGIAQICYIANVF